MRPWAWTLGSDSEIPLNSLNLSREGLSDVMIEILGEDLGVSEIGLESTLDDLGIDSLSVTDLLYELERRLDQQIELKYFGRNQTLRSLIGTIYELLVSGEDTSTDKVYQNGSGK